MARHDYKHSLELRRSKCQSLNVRKGHPKFLRNKCSTSLKQTTSTKYLPSRSRVNYRSTIPNPNLSVNHLRGGMKGGAEGNDSISAWNEWIPVSWMLNAISLSSQPANNAVESKKRRKKNGRRFHAQESAARFFCSDLPLFRLSTYQSKKKLEAASEKIEWLWRCMNGANCKCLITATKMELL